MIEVHIIAEKGTHEANLLLNHKDGDDIVLRIARVLVRCHLCETMVQYEAPFGLCQSCGEKEAEREQRKLTAFGITAFILIILGYAALAIWT
jgi:hypothetical protein